MNLCLFSSATAPNFGRYYRTDKNSEIGQKMKRAAQNISSDDMVEFVLSGGIDPMANIALSYLQNLAKATFSLLRLRMKPV